MSVPRHDRGERLDRLALGLRLVAAAALTMLALTLFREPLRMLAGNRLPALGALSLPRLGWWGSASSPPPAPGFVLSARSLPAGGRIAIDGVDRGTLPAVLNVACRAGDAVALAVELPGHAPWRRTVACREGASLVVRATLSPRAGAAPP